MIESHHSLFVLDRENVGDFGLKQNRFKTEMNETPKLKNKLSMFRFATLANGVNKEQGLKAKIEGFSEL